MERWLLLVESNCEDKNREGEFNSWYDAIHIPDVLSGSPGFKSATRYVLKEPSENQGIYLAVYEIETEDIDRTMLAHKKNMEGAAAAGRNSELLQIVSRRLCKVK